jgi:hypothetical protein
LYEQKKVEGNSGKRKKGEKSEYRVQEIEKRRREVSGETVKGRNGK